MKYQFTNAIISNTNNTKSSLKILERKKSLFLSNNRRKKRKKLTFKIINNKQLCKIKNKNINKKQTLEEF